MSEMATVWTARSNRPDLVNVACRMADFGYTVGMMQLRRIGGQLEVVGTDNYVLFRAVADCDFDGWPDGEHATVDKWECTDLRAIRKFVVDGHVESPYPLTIKVERVADKAAIIEFSSSDSFGLTKSCEFECVDRKLIDVAMFEGLTTDGADGRIWADTKTWSAIGKLTGWSPGTWALEDHGPGKAFRLDKVSEPGTFIIAMPARRDQKEAQG